METPEILAKMGSLYYQHVVVMFKVRFLCLKYFLKMETGEKWSIYKKN